MKDSAPKTFLAATTATILTDYFRKIGEPKFRAKQVLDWVFKKWTTNPDNMLNVSKSIRESLKNDFVCESASLLKVNESAEGTKKMLLKLHDGEIIECAVIPSPRDERTTFCLSTQVGCPVGCVFCASGKGGLKRNLLAGEIMEQFFQACRLENSLPDNIVFMGIGEGLLNFKNLAEALEMLSDPDRVGLAQRRITVSTSGWAKGIRQLADLDRQFNLAVSLHAPDDTTRAKIIPDKFRVPISEILEACDYYFKKTGRLITFEYTIIKGVNDAKTHAENLAKLAMEHNAKINLIPYNDTGVKSMERPEMSRIREFESVLERKGAKVTLRVEKGSSINAACGQLRTSWTGK